MPVQCCYCKQELPAHSTGHLKTSDRPGTLRTRKCRATWFLPNQQFRFGGTVFIDWEKPLATVALNSIEHLNRLTTKFGQIDMIIVFIARSSDGDHNKQILDLYAEASSPVIDAISPWVRSCTPTTKRKWHAHISFIECSKLACYPLALLSSTVWSQCTVRKRLTESPKHTWARLLTLTFESLP